MPAPRVLDGRAVAEFLRSVRPLDGLTEEQLAQLALHFSVEQYRAGEVVLDAFASSPGQLFGVWRGRVDLWVSADRLSELPDESVPPGQLFGYTAALVGEAVGPRAVASTQTVVVRLDAELAAPAFASASGARFLAAEVSETNRRHVGLPSYTVVDDLVVKPALVVDAYASIATVAAKMVQADVSCAAIQLAGGGYGIVTDATLRRVLGTRSATDRPATEVMEVDPPTVRSGASAAEGLITMLERDAEFLLVEDNADGLRGVIGTRDFVVSSTTAGASLHEQIRRASTVEDLASRYRLVPPMLADLSARGLAPSRIITVHSAIVDTVVRRAVALVLERHDDLQADNFTWLSLGSNGRREAVLSSDIDAAASFDDRADAADICRYPPVFTEINQVLRGRLGWAARRPSGTS